jgi:hypothetical protein
MNLRPFLAVLASPKSKAPGAVAQQAFREPLLDVTDLEDAFVEELMSRSDRDWGKDFQMFKSEGITEALEEESMRDRVQTVRKSKMGNGMFNTPENRLLVRVMFPSRLKLSSRSWLSTGR